MNKNITINPDEIRKLPDNSITDGETIRQIALYGIKTNDSSLDCKIKKEFTFAALYPEVMSIHNITPDPYIQNEKPFSGGLHRTIKCETGIESIDGLLDGWYKPYLGKTTIIDYFNLMMMSKAKELGLTVILNGVEITQEYLDNKILKKHEKLVSLNQLMG